MLQQPNRSLSLAEVHVTLCRRQVGMARQLLNRLAGAPRIAKCEQNVWRKT